MAADRLSSVGRDLRENGLPALDKATAQVSSALTDAAFASLETLKDECAALAAEVADAARQSGKNIQAELWSGLPPDAAISSAIDGVIEALATSCDGISTAMHLDTDTAQVVDLMTAARAPLFTYAQDITPLNAGDAAGSCDDAAERRKE